MKIREARVEDAAQIGMLLHSIRELDSITGGGIESTFEKVLENLLDVASSPTSVVLVAEHDEGTLLGYCAAHWVPLLFLQGGEAYVTELFVRPQDSGQGIGSGLLAEIGRLAAGHGCSRMSLLNGRQGESYRRQFYAKQGWVERQEMVNFILSLGPAD